MTKLLITATALSIASTAHAAEWRTGLYVVRAFRTVGLAI